MAKKITCSLSSPSYAFSKTALQLTGMLTVQGGRRAMPTGDLFAGDVRYPGCVKSGHEGDGPLQCSLHLEIPVTELSNLQRNSILSIEVLDGGKRVCIPILSPRPQTAKPTKLMYVRPDLGKTIRFVERTKQFRLIVRKINHTDSKWERCKLGIASHLARIFGKDSRIVMYEKECSRYEESASVVFEQLIDEGRTDVRFILDRNCPYREGIDPKYRRYIVDRFSMKHYYNLFAARCFIATEMLGHSLEKWNVSEYYRREIRNGSKDFVFLQHGVMYMVSLNAEQRTFFEVSDKGGRQRIVVSSHKEAEHFLQYTEYNAENLYICGLPKFDRNQYDADADRIVIMLTWRPWEFSQGTGDLHATSYYEMLRRMVEAVPQELRDKLLVLPHPLLTDQARKHADADPVWRYYDASIEKYDTVLRHTRLLITDYSSISYDAFYRGSGVIFVWSEKDACMQHYGGDAHIMLTEEDAFGPVCYDAASLTEMIRRRYEMPQSPDDRKHYQQLVEFHDGRNTQRLMELLRADHLI